MYVSSREARTITKYLTELRNSGIITDIDVEKRLSELETGFDWVALARYALWIAAICLFIAVVAFFSDHRILRYIMQQPHGLRAIVAGIFAAILCVSGLHIRKTEHAILANLAFFFFCGACICAWWQLAEAFGGSERDYNNCCLCSVVLLCFIGLWIDSGIVWLCGLLNLGSYIGMETGYVSGWGMYFLGMNYPFRFFIVGLVMAGITWRLQAYFEEKGLYEVTISVSLLYLFLSLWLLSLFGMKEFGELRSTDLDVLFWSLMFGAISIGAIVVGIRIEDKIFRGFGISFLGILLFTKYFEHFWDSMHKALFFGLLGCLLALFARYHTAIKNAFERRFLQE